MNSSTVPYSIVHRSGVHIDARFIVIASALIALCPIFFANAWVSDDAFITLRTVSNAARGYGFTWNTFERVQAYTHPLWMLLILSAHSLTGEYFFTVIALSFACSGCAFALALWHLSRTNRIAPILLVFALWINSKALIDFSSSGLENPLIFLLITVCWLQSASKEANTVRILTLLTSTIYITRPDAVILVLPLLALSIAEALRTTSPRNLAYALMLGATPALAWTAFSLVYYGFPFPNTAYAKLGTGIDRLSLARQGINYCMNSLRWDPITLPVLVLSTGIALLQRNMTLRALALGAVLYVAYTISVGGDFMSGRFFAAPFFLSTLLLGELARSWSNKCLTILVITTVAAGALFSPRPPWLSGSSYKKLGIDTYRIADERGHYYADLGFLPYLERARSNRRGTQIMHRAYREGLQARIERQELSRRDAIGMYGFAAGPTVRIIDQYALAEPLLARLPAINRARWRIGHFRRRTPPGYEETIRSGENKIHDPDLREYYEKLRLITQGPLWSWERWKVIAAMNLGHYQPLINKYLERTNATPAA